MAAIPSAKNYQIPTGIVYFMETGQSTWRDLGNCPKVTLKPNLETKEHKSSRDGARSTDRVFVTSKDIDVTLSLEEITPENLRLFWLGTQSTNSDAQAVIDIFTVNSITGSLKFTGTNEVGSTYEVILEQVEFLPSDSMDLIADDLISLPLTGKASKVNGSFGTFTKTGDEA